MKVVVLEKDYMARHASGSNAGSVHHISRLVPELPLAEVALTMWNEIEALLDDDCGFQRVGHLKLAESPVDLESMIAAAERLRSACGIVEQFVEADRLRDIVPELGRGHVGAIFSPHCGQAQPARTVRAMRRKAQRHGTTFVEGVEVREVGRRAGVWEATGKGETYSAPVLVNCAGAWGGTISACVGEPVALTPLALMVTALSPMRRLLGPVIGLASRLLSVKQFNNGSVVVGGGYRGTPLLAEGRAELDYGKLGYNLQAAVETLPHLKAGKIVRCWAGLEGRSPDGLPIIGPSATELGLWHAFGFSTHGFFLGPAVGRMIADEILGLPARLSLAPFGIGRFLALTVHSRATALQIRNQEI